MLATVIGGGISGLTAAFQLRQLGTPVLLLEQSERVGGVLRTIEKDGFLFEMGPQSLLSSDPLLELMRSLGLEGELLRADPKATRYVLVRGRLHPVRTSPPGLLTTPLLTLGAKLRLLSEPLRWSQPTGSDESVAAFVRRKFGQEALENLVGPFVSGVYAGDPEKLSLRSAFPALYEWEKKYGSIIRGAAKWRPPKGKLPSTLCSFQGGVETLARALRDQLREHIRTNTYVEAFRRSKSNGSSQFEIQIVANGKTATITSDAVVMATPADAAAKILSGVSTQFEKLLNRIEYAAVMVLGEGYRREQIRHELDGFGFLVPRKEGLRLLGTVWNSSLFPGRAPDGMALLASFAGGTTDPHLLELTNDEIVTTVEQELGQVLHIAGDPVTRVVWRHRRALPQYNLGHAQIVASLQEEAARFPGLFFAGNYLHGPSVPGCIEQSMRTAQVAHEYLRALHAGS
jgi:oxygen-dependent protoporphyrinogen oxidase